MVDLARFERNPNYPRGNWIDQERWNNSGIEEIYESARQSRPLEPGSDPSSEYLGLYAQNELGVDRLIPLQYDPLTGELDTVIGVFDSNPGETQRCTGWDYSYTEEEIFDDIDVSDADVKLVELNEGSVEQIESAFGRFVAEDGADTVNRLLKYGVSSALNFF